MAAYFSGVFRKLVYDTLTSAVKKILRGHQREQTARFIAIRSHWRFESEFCNPEKRMRKAGSKEKLATFEGITECRCRRRKISLP